MPFVLLHVSIISFVVPLLSRAWHRIGKSCATTPELILGRPSQTVPTPAIGARSLSTESRLYGASANPGVEYASVYQVPAPMAVDAANGASRMAPPERVARGGAEARAAKRREMALYTHTTLGSSRK